MIYIEPDLDYIYIRATKKGKWDSLSLNEVTDRQFVAWIKSRFGLEIRDDETAKGTKWTKEQKVNVLNFISEKSGGAEIVTMLKRSAR